jgi:hypothetical protein
MAVSSWDLNAGNQGGEKVEFTKFPEGITRIRIIDDAPYQRWTHFIRKFSRSINCPGRGCPICDIRKQQKANKMPYTYDMGKRFAINIINRETGNVEIMEQGKTFFQDIIDLKADLEEQKTNVRGADLKVRRRGTGKDDTSYRIDIDKVYELSDTDKELLEKRMNFEEYFKPHTTEQITRIVQGEDWAEVMNSNEGIETPAVNADGSVNLAEDESIELA